MFGCIRLTVECLCVQLHRFMAVHIAPNVGMNVCLCGRPGVCYIWA